MTDGGTYVLLLDLGLITERDVSEGSTNDEKENTDLLLGSKVVDDVEKLADLFWGLALDHVCHSLATDITIEMWLLF